MSEGTNNRSNLSNGNLPKCKFYNQAINSFEDATVDHIIRWSEGDPTNLENASLVHLFCNSSDGGEFARARKMEYDLQK